jgi:hypothetical protein
MPYNAYSQAEPHLMFYDQLIRALIDREKKFLSE